MTPFLGITGMSSRPQSRCRYPSTNQTLGTLGGSSFKHFGKNIWWKICSYLLKNPFGPKKAFYSFWNLFDEKNICWKSVFNPAGGSSFKHFGKWTTSLLENEPRAPPKAAQREPKAPQGTPKSSPARQRQPKVAPKEARFLNPAPSPPPDPMPLPAWGGVGKVGAGFTNLAWEGLSKYRLAGTFSNPATSDFKCLGFTLITRGCFILSTNKGKNK